MKLSPRDSQGYLKSPDTSRAGLLIFGADAMRVALKREEFLKNLLGPDAAAEMRLIRVSGADLRKDPALLQDGLKSQGFFPGQRAVFVEDASDTIAEIIGAGLNAWNVGDATILVCAGQLKPTSKLRKSFESHPNAYCLAVYDDPPTRQDIENELKTAGLSNIPSTVLALLTDLARELEPGDFRQTIQKIGLYKHGDHSPLTPHEVELCAPTSNEADLDDILQCVANGQVDKIGPIMKRLRSQGVQAVALVIAASRHFKSLYTVAADPGGVGSGIGNLRPPVFGPRRDLIQRQASQWGAHRLGEALTILTDIDLQLRFANQHAPSLELVERAFIRLAMFGRK